MKVNSKMFERIEKLSRDKYDDDVIVRWLEININGKKYEGITLEFFDYDLHIYEDEEKNLRFMLEDDEEILAEGLLDWLDELVSIWMKYGKYIKSTVGERKMKIKPLEVKEE